jgi:hypothetical protein
VCHQMKLLLREVASFVQAPLREKLAVGSTAQQLHGLWFMGLIKTLLNAGADTWKDLKDLYFVVIVLLVGCAIFLSIPDEQLRVCKYEVRCGMSVYGPNCMVNGFRLKSRVT